MTSFVFRLSKMNSSLLGLVPPQTFKVPRATYFGRNRVGNRDVVGFGINGQANYFDRLDFPFPATRFRENTPDILVCVT